MIRSAKLLFVMLAALWAAPALAAGTTGGSGAPQASLSAGDKADHAYPREGMEPAVAGRERQARTCADPSGDDDGAHAAAGRTSPSRSFLLATTLPLPAMRGADVPHAWHSRAPPAR